MTLIQLSPFWLTSWLVLSPWNFPWRRATGIHLRTLGSHHDAIPWKTPTAMTAMVRHFRYLKLGVPYHIFLPYFGAKKTLKLSHCIDLKYINMVGIALIYWLVVEPPLWKVLVSWDDEIPNIWKVIIQSCSKPPTNLGSWNGNWMEWKIPGLFDPVKPNEDDFRTRFWTAAVHRPAYECHRQLGL